MFAGSLKYWLAYWLVERGVSCLYAILAGRGLVTTPGGGNTSFGGLMPCFRSESSLTPFSNSQSSLRHAHRQSVQL